MDDEKKQPLTVNGAMLVMEEVVWAQPEDVEMWKKSLRMVAGKWMSDQITADVPFIPPDSAKVMTVMVISGGGKGWPMVGLLNLKRLNGDVDRPEI